MLYHAFPTLIKGGFVGVDVFFVISGFLISTIIFQNLEKGTFSFAEFYARRIARIFPALFIVMLATLAFAWFTLLPKPYAELGKHVMGGAGFVSNLMLWSEAGYFDSPAKFKPLLHLWSLGVEEQFYLVWPLILFFAWKRRVNLLAAVAVVWVLSFWLNIHTVHTNATAAFYSPLSRFWELLIGAALAYLSLHKNAALTGVRDSLDGVFSTSDNPKKGTGVFCSNVLSVAGAALLAVGFWKITDRLPFPGWWAMFPSVGACLLIAAGPNGLVNRLVLSNRLFVFIGLISYPLYLWHWPILVFTKLAYSGNPPAVALFAAVALSAFLAWATYRFIEKKIRNGQRQRLKVVVLSVAMVILATAGATVYWQKGFPSRFDGVVRQYSQFISTFKPHAGARRDECWMSEKDAPDGYSPSCVDAPAKGKPLVFLWGDSHAARFYPGLAAMDKGHFRIAQFTRDSCPPISDFSYENCVKSYAPVLEKVKETKPDVVVLFAVWNDYTELSHIDIKRLNSTVEKLKALGVPKIIVMGPAPKWSLSLPENMVKISQEGLYHSVPERTFIGLDPSSKKIDEVMAKQFAGMAGVEYFSTFNAFCNQDGCLTRTTPDITSLPTYDYGHLTQAGGEYLAQKLMEATGNFGVK